MSSTFWQILGISIIALAAIITWSKQREDEEALEDDKEPFDDMIARRTGGALKNANIHASESEKRVLDHYIKMLVQEEKALSYKEAFHLGQQIKLQEGLDVPEEVSQEIMKNQTKSPL